MTNAHTIYLKAAVASCLVFLVACAPIALSAQETATFSVESVAAYFQPPPGFIWMQARACAIPSQRAGSPPQVLLTMQPHAVKGTHTYQGIASALSDDLGQTWQGPTEQPALDHRHVKGPIYETPVDSTPFWHAKTGKVLLVGATFFVDNEKMHDVPKAGSDAFYAVYDPETKNWDVWKKLKMPRSFGHPYARAGCAQIVVLPGGDILLPIYYGQHNNSNHYSTVVRCRFDGETLRYVEHGSELFLNSGRGYSEPSLAECGGRYYLTLRNDKADYVTAGDDGLHFAEPQLWRFGDGEELGSYNTQQHWTTHRGRLYLLYTRRGADNDDVFRHRAPLFMAEVDQATLRVKRETEQVVIPKQGASAMGNFGVSPITPGESWVVAGIRLLPARDTGPNVLVSRIHWTAPEDGNQKMR